jgi:hypothetical protein
MFPLWCMSASSVLSIFHLPQATWTACAMPVAAYFPVTVEIHVWKRMVLKILQESVVGHRSPRRTGNTFLDMPNDIGAATEEHTTDGVSEWHWHMELKKRMEDTGEHSRMGWNVILDHESLRAGCSPAPNTSTRRDRAKYQRHKYAIYVTHHVHAHSFKFQCLK